jgi:Na+-translocating ferredoxin:NAD+ oxidoreductase RnfE subunit
MTLPPNDSMFWVLLRQVVICVVFGGFALFAYQNKMSATDIMALLSGMGAVFGLDLFKRTAAPAGK